MPVDVHLGTPPMGVALDDAHGEGAPIRVAIREFTSSEDGEVFTLRAEGLVNHLLTFAAPGLNPSAIDHVVGIIRRDGTARVYVNECNIFIRARMGRTIQKGEVVGEGDLVDVAELKFENVEFPADAAVVVLLSAGWRKGLFFDFGPLQPDGGDRDFDLPKLLGSHYAYLRSQGVFRLSEEDWNYLIQRQWFPFISLPPALRSRMARFAKERRDLDLLLNEATTAVKNGLSRMKERWLSSAAYSEHYPLIEHAINRFEESDYISASAILYPRVEGVMRGNLKTRVRATQTYLTDAVIEARADEYHDFSLLVPEMFRRYLDEAYFASFTPGQESTFSRNSLAHGVAPVGQFSEKSALLGLLILDQLYYFLPQQQTGVEANSTGAAVGDVLTDSDRS